jgi:hypothetical protein
MVLPLQEMGVFQSETVYSLLEDELCLLESKNPQDDLNNPDLILLKNFSVFLALT